MDRKEIGWKWSEFIWFRTGAVVNVELNLRGPVKWWEQLLTSQGPGSMTLGDTYFQFVYSVQRTHNKLAFNLRKFCNGWSDPGQYYVIYTGKKTSLCQVCPHCTWRARYDGVLGRVVCMHSTTSVLYGCESQASRSTRFTHYKMKPLSIRQEAVHCPRVGLDMVARRKIPDSVVICVLVVKAILPKAIT
jgi:hypothetical protein